MADPIPLRTILADLVPTLYVDGEPVGPVKMYDVEAAYVDGEKCEVGVDLAPIGSRDVSFTVETTVSREQYDAFVAMVLPTPEEQAEVKRRRKNELRRWNALTQRWGVAGARMRAVKRFLSRATDADRERFWRELQEDADRNLEEAKRRAAKPTETP